ncbi:hypothetical protein SLE2022_255150 [Rubroshorea leprosula]
MAETKPHRRLWRRQRLQVPIGVNFRQQHLQETIGVNFRQQNLQGPIGVDFRQQHLQRAMNTLRCMKVMVAAMKIKTKRMKKSHKKAKVKLRGMEAESTKQRAERRHALEESACTQACHDTMVTLLFAQAIGDFALVDQLQASLQLIIFPELLLIFLSKLDRFFHLKCFLHSFALK